MIDARTPGALHWVDLSTPDVEGAARFYSDLFGWTLERSTTPMGEYLIAAHEAGQAAGIMQQGREMAGAPAMWTTFFFSADVAASQQRVVAAGGAVLQEPFTLPDGGVVGVAADPTGAMFGLITQTLPEGMVYVSEAPGAVCWVEVLTRDTTAAEGFYAAVFDWKAQTTPTDGTGTAYTVFTLDEDAVAGMLAMPDEVPSEAPSHWAVYFAVEECAAAERRAVELGGRVARPTHEIPTGRFAVLEDPQGGIFSIMEIGE